MKILEGMSIEQVRIEAARPTPQPMSGTWRLVAPDGREWTAEDPVQCAIKEGNDRIPPLMALARIRLAVEEPEPEDARIAAAEQMAKALEAAASASTTSPATTTSGLTAITTSTSGFRCSNNCAPLKPHGRTQSEGSTTRGTRARDDGEHACDGH